MSMTTDLGGGLYGPTEEEIKQEAALRKAMALQQQEYDLKKDLAAYTASLKEGNEHKIIGMPTAQRRPDLRHLQSALLAGAGLGEPTSYGGQKPLTAEEAAAGEKRRQAGLQEFSEPIAVTRGMTTTYQGPRYGQEFATPEQAYQAFRRELGVGEYMPTGATLAREKAAATLTALRAQAKGELSPERYFREYLLLRYGVTDDKTGEKNLPDYAREYYFENLPKIKSLDDARRLVDEADKILGERKKDFDLMGRLNHPQQMVPLRAQMEKEYLNRVGGEANADPKIREYIRAAPVTRDNLQFFKSLLQESPLTKAPQPVRPAPQVPAPRAAAPGEGQQLLRDWELKSGALAGPGFGAQETGLTEGLKQLGATVFGTPESWKRAGELMRLAEEERQRRRSLTGGY